MANEAALNRLYELRRNAQRAYDKAKTAGDRVGMQRHKKRVEELDGEIENLK